MGKGSGWLIALLVVALLVSACGPEMATPTPSTESAGASPSATVEDAGETPDSPAASAELPVDSDDWHVLGSPEASVTIIEYSDFQ
jgi:hypothetical protein